MENQLMLILYAEYPAAIVRPRNGLFIPSEVLDWFAETRDLERKNLQYSIINVIDYDIDKDEVRNKKYGFQSSNNRSS